MSTDNQQATPQARRQENADRTTPAGMGRPQPPEPGGESGVARKDAGSNAPQQAGQSHVSKISREDAERSLAPDPDPDDPVSP